MRANSPFSKIEGLFPACELLFADDLAVVTATGELGDAEEMTWLADWDEEQGTKSQHMENGSDGQ